MDNINIHTDSPGYGTNIALLDGGRIAHTKYGSVFSQRLDDTIELMQSYLKNIQGGKFVEIGVLGGASLLYNYDLCKTNNIEIYGIDPIYLANKIDEIANTDISEQSKQAREYAESISWETLLPEYEKMFQKAVDLLQEVLKNQFLDLV